MNDLLLTFFIFSPLLGILLLTLTPKKESRTVRALGLFGTVLPFGMAIVLACTYASGKSLSLFDEKVKWITFGDFAAVDKRWFSIYYELGIDGLSLVMMVLTALLATLAAIAAFTIKRNLKAFYMLLLVLEIGMLGVFAAQNLMLFFIFFEITLPPMFLLIGKWGKLSSEKAAYSYLIYNGIGSAILLIVFSVLFAKTGTTNITELKEILTSVGAGGGMAVPNSLQFGLFLSIMIAFAIKLPVFPLHRWMVNVHIEAHPAVVMLHAGVLLKIGAYGIIRFGQGLFPEYFREFATIIAILGVINLLYGAFLALIQTDFRKVLAYSSISHMGIVLMGLGALNAPGTQGALFQVVSHGLIAALLFFLLGVIEQRFGTSDITALGGLAKSVPVLSGFFLAGGMASLGLPGMSGFVSEFLAFLGLFQGEPVIAAAGVLGIILTAVYVLRATLQVTFGKKEWEAKADIHGWEYVPILLLIFCIIAIGVMPEILGDPLQNTLKTLGVK
ncbi:NADH-quinone oxidoreductase subunit M [Bacillus paranthracis]|uniref:NADH-quinone oxidoreductase subunit M n=1 Tax=Bacillus paranthracis TaxID=2026186 RepID=UPI000200F9D9|nr:NADH-quinone oxidoreductase subunit M [Bacillus paranthracis]ADY24499.1 NADH:ubiquinone oxidoreductase subunit M [Bacillus thuringiensis serovar finitimus YBT-020]MRC72600.1 NADH-quinone oxidoreductase subunit M [Bacillus thuringiensis]OTX72964.1 NADH-quinone oxidoreductase subunit M [Bacillus thuringiensis serovar finitimus]MCR6800791.1 NADH-quinone oxidoreductase subunit M [Bacillus paranthracis]MEC3357066.1 NADH-quinone oxidoreductase subunit M [Bacillus paranthracis]